MGKLNELNVGDAVALVSRHSWTGRLQLTRGTVERLTKTQIVALGGRKFRISNGVEFGQGYGRFSVPPELMPLTDDLVEEEKEALSEMRAEKKCREWVEALSRANGQEAKRLADLLPEFPPPPTN